LRRPLQQPGAGEPDGKRGRHEERGLAPGKLSGIHDQLIEILVPDGIRQIVDLVGNDADVFPNHRLILLACLATRFVQHAPQRAQ
jgi:hypothetical protein